MQQLDHPPVKPAEHGRLTQLLIGSQKDFTPGNFLAPLQGRSQLHRIGGLQIATLDESRRVAAQRLRRLYNRPLLSQPHPNLPGVPPLAAADLPATSQPLHTS